MAVFAITSPTGEKYQITAPDDATHEQVMSYAQQNMAPTNNAPNFDSLNLPGINSQSATLQDSPNFYSRESSDLSKRWQQIKEAQARNPDASFSGSLQAAGIGAGAVGDLFANAFGSAGRELGDLTGTRQPILNAANSYAQGATQLGRNLADTGFGRTVGPMLGAAEDKVQQLAQQYPNTAADISAIGNIASLLPINKATGLAQDTIGQVPGAALNATGDALTQWGEKSAAAKAAKGAVKDVTPLLTNKKAIQQGVPQRTVEGIFQSEVIPKEAQQAAADQLAQIPGYKPNISFHKKLKLVEGELDTTTKGLGDYLAQTGIQFQPEEFQQGLLDIKKQIKSMEGVSDAKRAAMVEPVDAMMQITRKTTNPADLWKNRITLDSDFFGTKGELSPAAQKIYKDAIAPIRDYTNNFIANKVPYGGVKESLAKQSALILARDSIAPKAQRELATVVGRFVQRASDAVPIKNSIVKYGAEAAGLATMAAHPVTTGAALGLGSLYKGLAAPTTRKVAGKTLSTAGRIVGGKK